MTKSEEYEMIVNMIDNTQKQIALETKDRIYLIAELELLQQDLAELRTNGRIKRTIQIERKEEMTYEL